ncbi:DUF4349 domain-containing protein [Microbacterium nymphoidis]|uniref:DUF4349 domain-containing protein n=1 Tax=Microbacterium nymphoidis TaxID=2898586 RepID=UPI001E65A2FC|nr:DUF4349 domain-containing protein [Microbacterium nymphoidis]MCD2497094.1 DUF4349 domain-containing protein [Microbacterium nymphoidis]
MKATPPLAKPELPELDASTIDRMEDAVFARIATQTQKERAAAARRHRRRLTAGWTTAAATVAVVAAGAVVGPQLIASTVAQDSSAGSSAWSEPAGNAVPDLAAVDAGKAFEGAPEASSLRSDASAAGGANAAVTPVEPQIITTADVGLQVEDITAATAQLTIFAQNHDGYVASQSVGSGGGMTEPLAADVRVDYGYISLRIPESDIDAAIADLADLGTVVSQSVNRTDVTAQSVDLQARVDSLSTSVARLQDLMKASGSVADLVAAESALAERQAELESLQQQLASLQDQVAMSTLSVNLSLKSTSVAADPAGFGDGFWSGWNGLIAAGNALLIALGFAVPWLVVIGVILLIVLPIIRAVQNRRRARREASGEAEAEADDAALDEALKG